MLGLGIQLPWRQQALGIPRSGLVCWHDLWFPNVLLYSNTFSAWSSARASVLQSASVYTPDGSLAWKLVEDDTATATHYLSKHYRLGVGTYTLRLLAKADERTTVYLLAYSPANGNKSAFFNMSTGVTSGVSAGCSSAMISRGDGWWECLLTYPVTDISDSIYQQIFLCSDSPSVTYSGTGTEPYTEDDPGLYIADAQLYPSATLPPYSATTTLQSESGLLDLSGNGYHLQRGSTLSADTNDPTVLGPGLSFVTDDYALTGDLSGVDMAGDWTVVLCGLWNLYDAYGTLWSLSTATHWHRLFRVADGVSPLRAQSYAGAGANYTTEPTLKPSHTSPVALALVAAGDTLTLTDLGTGRSSVGANAKPIGACRIGLGCVSTATISGVADAMTAYSHLFYSRALSDGEIQRIYRSLKATWAARGVTIL